MQKGSLFCGSGGVPQLPVWFPFRDFQNQLLMRYDLCSHAVTYWHIRNENIIFRAFCTYKVHNSHMKTLHNHFVLNERHTCFNCRPPFSSKWLFMNDLWKRMDEFLFTLIFGQRFNGMVNHYIVTLCQIYSWRYASVSVIQRVFNISFNFAILLWHPFELGFRG